MHTVKREALRRGLCGRFRTGHSRSRPGGVVRRTTCVGRGNYERNLFDCDPPRSPRQHSGWRQDQPAPILGKASGASRDRCDLTDFRRDNRHLDAAVAPRSVAKRRSRCYFKFVPGQDPFDHVAADSSELQQWLRAHNAPSAEVIPAALQTLPTLGCKTIITRQAGVDHVFQNARRRIGSFDRDERFRLESFYLRRSRNTSEKTIG